MGRGQGTPARGAHGDGRGRQCHPGPGRPGPQGGPAATEPHVPAGGRQPGARIRQLRHRTAEEDVRRQDDVRRRAARLHHARHEAAADRPAGDQRHPGERGLASRAAGLAGGDRSEVGRDRGDGRLGEPQRRRRPVQPRGMAAPQPRFVDEDLHLHGGHRERPVRDDDTGRGRALLVQRQNYDGRYHGTCQLQQCMGNSLNIPAVKVEVGIGVPLVVQTARDMGAPPWQQQKDGSFTNNDDPRSFGPSLTLGGYGETPLQMATAASVLAAQGVLHKPFAIARVERGGSTVYQHAEDAHQVVDPKVAFIVATMMVKDENRAIIFGRNSQLTIPGWQVAAKTGTSDSFADAWSVGFTPKIAVAVWMGSRCPRGTRSSPRRCRSSAPSRGTHPRRASSPLTTTTTCRARSPPSRRPPTPRRSRPRAAGKRSISRATFDRLWEPRCGTKS
ncbi:MAG: hypothetical protein E6I92_04700 [Chloroflexi bacterium]|nr:MAG: hypothetical protein E6I92_04700 [Chloroflexota bacterium]